ncbi:MAG TPA: hypothetical protein VH643_25715 [Gemmataceae bacterium]|jgi:hypothetical protein
MEHVMDDVRRADLRSAQQSVGRFPRWADVLQAILVLVSAVQIARCSGKPWVWVALASVVPLARFCGVAAYRRRVVAWVGQVWASAEAFAAEPVRLPWRAAVLLVVLPAVLFFLSQTRPIRTGDSKPVTLTASSLVCERSSDLSPYVSLWQTANYFNAANELPYFFLQTPHGIYSHYPSGMVVFALPPTALARLLGADLHKIRTQDHLEKAIASALAAVCLGLFFLLALHVVDARSAWLTTLLLAVGSALCSTIGQALWQHGGVVFWLLLALLVEFRTWRRHGGTSVLLQGVALAMMFACRMSSALLILPFGLWILRRAPRRALLVGLVAAVAYLPWAWYYRSLYGTALGPQVGQAIGFTWNWREALLPILIGPDHGLIVYQPWILLGLAACVPAVRRLLPVGEPADLPNGWRWACVSAIGLHLALIASWNCWWGGDCWGSRLATETVPLFALLCLRPIAALRRLAWGRRAVLATAVLAAVLHLTGVYLKADYQAVQRGIFTHCPAQPGSWENLPFLTPFIR